MPPAFYRDTGEDGAPLDGGPGLCTSIVARASNGDIIHGRNLDWNLNDDLLQFAIDVEFQRGNVTVYRGSTLVGFVGILHGMNVVSLPTNSLLA